MTADTRDHRDHRSIGMLARPSRRDLLAGSMLLAVTVASQWLRPTRTVAKLAPGVLAAAVPKTLGPYRFVSTSGLVLPPADELSQKLYDEVLTRVYAAKQGPPVLALLAYGSVQNLSLELHRPEECYPQQGFTISEPDTLALRLAGVSIPASVLTARRPSGYVEQVVFWSRIGGRFPPSRTAQEIMVAQENFAGRMPDGILVRLSIPTASRAEGVAAATAFLDALAGALAPTGRKLVFGPHSKDTRLS